MIVPSNANNQRLPAEEALVSVRPVFHPLLAQLTQRTASKAHHRMMFVSPDHGDGTTTLATCAALMLVRHFRRDVALIEANFYTPAMASYLGISPRPGLLDMADGSASQEDVVRNSKLHGLYVMSGGGDRRPAEGELAGEEIRGLIDHVSDEHRYTIIDAPPLLEHPECCLLLEHVDEVILVVRAGSTHKKHAQAAVQILEDAGVEVSGVFLNRFKAHMPFGIGSRNLA